MVGLHQSSDDALHTHGPFFFSFFIPFLVLSSFPVLVFFFPSFFFPVSAVHRGGGGGMRVGELVERMEKEGREVEQI